MTPKIVCLGPANLEFILDHSTIKYHPSNRDCLSQVSEGKHDLRKGTWAYKGPWTQFDLSIVNGGGDAIPVRFEAPSNYVMVPAGSALNVAMGERRAGHKPILVTALPDDDAFADSIRDYVASNDVDIFTFRRDTTPVTFIIMEGQGPTSKSRVLSRKPPYDMSKSRRKEVAGIIINKMQPTHLLATGIRESELSLVQLAFLKAKQTGKQAGREIVTGLIPNPIILRRQPGPIRDNFIQTLQHTDILQMNQREACVFLGKSESAFNEDDVRVIAKRIGSGASVKIIIVTRGADGAVVYDTEERRCYHEEAQPTTNVVDTTGAGDAFFAAFVDWYAIKKRSIALAIRIASFAAACNIAQQGGHGGMPSRDHIERFIATLNLPGESHRTAVR